MEQFEDDDGIIITRVLRSIPKIIAKRPEGIEIREEKNENWLVKSKLVMLVNWR